MYENIVPPVVSLVERGGNLRLTADLRDTGSGRLRRNQKQKLRNRVSAPAPNRNFSKSRVIGRMQCGNRFPKKRPVGGWPKD